MYIHSARKVWQVAYLFKTLGVSSEQQARNRQDIDNIVRQCMEQVIHSFLPWESITKSLSAPAEPVAEEESDDEESEEESEKKNVKFEDEDEEEEPPKITLSDDVATIDIQEFEEPPEEEEEDPMKEIEKKVGESLVLKL